MKTTTQTPNAAGAMQPANQLAELEAFIGLNQLNAILDGIEGEESPWFCAKVREILATLAAMPKSYETDGQGMRATVWLRYFAGGSAAALITERDVDADGEGQAQAFGHADLFGDGGEMGYISIKEWIEGGAELDLHWTPKPLWQALGLRDPRDETRDRLALEKYGKTYRDLPDDGAEQDYIATEADRIRA